MAERLKAPVLKTGVRLFRIVSSNLTLSAIYFITERRAIYFDIKAVDDKINQRFIVYGIQ